MNNLSIPVSWTFLRPLGPPAREAPSLPERILEAVPTGGGLWATGLPKRQDLVVLSLQLCGPSLLFSQFKCLLGFLPFWWSGPFYCLVSQLSAGIILLFYWVKHRVGYGCTGRSRRWWNALHHTSFSAGISPYVGSAYLMRVPLSFEYYGLLVFFLFPFQSLPWCLEFPDCWSCLAVMLSATQCQRGIFFLGWDPRHQ